MKLSELKTGTPIRIQAFEDDSKVSEIWGKIQKNSKNECQITIYYYEGGNINLNSPDYEIKAVVFCEGKEQEVEWKNRKVEGMPEKEQLVENRDAFRIYIGAPVECTVKGRETAGLLIDMSEGGFRILLRECYPVGVKTSVVIQIEDEEFDFPVSGVVVWENKMDDIKSVCGCSLVAGQDKEPVVKYIHQKQQKLFEELKKEISQ